MLDFDFDTAARSLCRNYEMITKMSSSRVTRTLGTNTWRIGSPLDWWEIGREVAGASRPHTERIRTKLQYHKNDEWEKYFLNSMSFQHTFNPKNSVIIFRCCLRALGMIHILRIK